MSPDNTYDACLELFKQWRWDRLFSPMIAVGMTVATAMKQLKGVPNVIVHGGPGSGKTTLFGVVERLIKRESSVDFVQVVTESALLKLAKDDWVAVFVDGCSVGLDPLRRVHRGAVHHHGDIDNHHTIECPYVAWISSLGDVGLRDRNRFVLLPIVSSASRSDSSEFDVFDRAAELNPHVTRVAGEILPAVQQRLDWIRGKALDEIPALYFRSAILHATPVAVVATMLELGNDETKQLLNEVAREDSCWLSDSSCDSE